MGSLDSVASTTDNDNADEFLETLDSVSSHISSEEDFNKFVSTITRAGKTA